MAPVGLSGDLSHWRVTPGCMAWVKSFIYPEGWPKTFGRLEVLFTLKVGPKLSEVFHFFFQAMHGTCEVVIPTPKQLLRPKWMIRRPAPEQHEQ